MITEERARAADAGAVEEDATLGTLLKRCAERHPERIAFRDSGAEIAFGELEARTATAARRLGELGVGPGSTVAAFLGNGVACLEVYIAAVRTGAILLPLAAQSTAPEVEYQVRDAGATVLITDAGRLARLGEVAEAVERTVVLEDGTLFEGGGDAPVDLSSAADPAWIMYTSGTTGNPKGVVLSQHSLLWTSSRCWNGIVGLGPDDQLLSPIPTHHSYGMGLTVVATLVAGCTTYAMRSFSTPDCFRVLGEHPITVLAGNPTTFAYLVRHAREFGTVDSQLRLCVTSSASPPPSLVEEVERVFGAQLVDGYGATELASMTTQVAPGERPPRGSAGRALPGIDLRVVDPETGEERPPGEPGELLITGPQVMLRYHGRPDATAETVRDGWYYSGDLATVDADGYLTVTGRKSEIIIRGGENIGPGEVEEAVLSHESVLECAVIGLPDEVMGEVPVACVVLADDAGEDFEAELRRHCRTRLARFKVPARFVRVDEVPKTLSGKVKRRLLRDALQTEGGAR
ncbi:MAG TPA: class I adenylate-forming enzyme family protein [Thermoleophilaceae bacterium]